MNDLDLRFRSLDELEAPDLTREIERRGRTPGPAPTEPSPRRRLLAAAVAIAVFAVAAVFAWKALRPAGGNPTPSSSTPSASPSKVGTALDQGWTRLPEPPVVRSSPAEVWDGSEFLVWGGTSGGADIPSAEGYALDPSTGTWRTLPPAPIARSGASAVWTGTEAIFWVGTTDRREPSTASRTTQRRTHGARSPRRHSSLGMARRWSGPARRSSCGGWAGEHGQPGCAVRPLDRYVAEARQHSLRTEPLQRCVDRGRGRDVRLRDRRGEPLGLTASRGPHV